MRRRGIGKDAAEHAPLPATGVGWPRGGPPPAPLEVPAALRYLAAWTRARVTAAITVARPRPTGGTLELYVCGGGRPTRAVFAGDLEIDANGDIVPSMPDLLERLAVALKHDLAAPDRAMRAENGASR